MNEIKQKYNNFIEFLSERVGNNEYIEDLKKVDVLIFIYSLKKRIEELELNKLSDIDYVDQAYTKILDKTSIKEEKFNKDDIDKFKKYLLYFKKISEIVSVSN